MLGHVPGMETFQRLLADAGAIVAISMIAVACVSSGAALGQSLVGPGKATDPKSDPVYVRELARYRPDLAAKLNKELQAAKTPEARTAILDKYQEELGKEMDNLSKVPEAIRPPHSVEQWTDAAFVVGEMRGVVNSRIQEIKERQAFEDAVIKDVGFKDAGEMYDYFRSQYPDDLGKRFMSDAKKLLDTGQTERFIERIELMQNLLEVFRTEAVPPSESILPSLTPYSPADRPKSETPTPDPQSAVPSGAISPCKQICDSPAMPAESRPWCEAHCNDEINP